MPPASRREVLSGLAPKIEFDIRRHVAEAYEGVAFREQTGGFRRARVIKLYEEALSQRTRLLAFGAVDPDPEETLEQALQDAAVLDFQYLEQGNEPAAAKEMWKSYRSAAAKAGFGEEREVDARFARCLLLLGNLEEADEILVPRTSAKYEDDLQILTLLLHAEVLKDLGKSGGREAQLRLLRRALEIIDNLRESGKKAPDSREAEVELSIGNALGYGEGSQPDQAVEHVARAVEIFERLHDPSRAESAYAEKIEIARYNGRLSDAERAEAIERIKKSLETLLSRSERREAINRLYELGRLETDWLRKAEWFHAAYERAGDVYAPQGWHAAIHWKCVEVQGGLTPFAAAAPEILVYCSKLDEWQEQAWSRRVLRNALLFLARGYAAAGDGARQRQFLLSCREVVTRIERCGEGRRDREIRAEVDEAIRALTSGEGKP
jgi:tetratricopeptide (TPR) repeat protein